MDYFHGIAINAKKEVLTNMSSETNTNVYGSSSGDIVYGGRINTNTTAHTTTRTSTTHMHIWTFQLKGQGKDLFRVALGENFAIVDGDEMTGYAERNGGYMDCGVTKNVTRNISNENQILSDTESLKPEFAADLVVYGVIAGGVLGLICNGLYFQWSYIASFIIGAIGGGILTSKTYKLLVYNKKLREYERILADTKQFLEDFENRIASEKIDEEIGLIINASPQEQIEATSEAEQIETK
ncbi:hypothetical protein [uncultured Campylobacter sp.]|jgi:hypothetical protein|uniref:hypothetical protein n=1 Tax=uncultured Campylobacter sp. TaxID=218934 RepID=UPI0015AC3CF8|nr:hypothetical protein [uncultured Campylobacter sp.]